MIEVVFYEIQVNEVDLSNKVILVEKDGERFLPIFIGPVEAALLEAAIHGTGAPRPLSHDLILGVIQSLGGRLDGILVDALEENTYYGKLLVKTPEGTTERVDCRPSDALILAMKEQVPIYVESSVLSDANQGPKDPDDEDDTDDE